MPPPTRDLEVLAAVEAGEIVSQLKLSQRVGIAVGLVNALLRRAIRKGLVKGEYVRVGRLLVAPVQPIEESMCGLVCDNIVRDSAENDASR